MKLSIHIVVVILISLSASLSEGEPSSQSNALSAQPRSSWPGAVFGGAIDIQVAGSYAYALLDSAEGGIIVIDLSDISQPVRVAEYDIGESPHGLALAGDRAFIAGPSGITTMDISDPLAATVTSRNTNMWSPRDLVSQGGFLYVTAYDSPTGALMVFQNFAQEQLLEIGRIEFLVLY